MRSLPAVSSVLCLVLVLGFLATPAAAQNPALQRAFGLVQAEDYPAAIALLDSVVAAEPENARAWSLLGTAYQKHGDLEPALAAHERATADPTTGPRAMVNAGITCALMGDPDAAFVWLERAKTTGKFEMTQIELDPDSESLRGDPRFRGLFPTEAEFARPFVEPARILHEWTGEASGDQFGWIARNIGDVDGDGVADVVTSAPSFGEDAGKVYVYSGATGAALWTRTGEPGDQLGSGVEAAGDVNADGVPDVIAGGPQGNKAFVFSGSDGEVLLSFQGEEEGDQFGRKVSDLGDLDGDGHDDVLVGAPGSDVAGEDAGRAYIFSGADGSPILVLNGEKAGDQYGSAAGGMRAAAHQFVVVGAPGAGPANGGRTYVYRGRTVTPELHAKVAGGELTLGQTESGGTSGECLGICPAPAFVIEADSTATSLGGMFVSVVGDIDADGTPDVYASDWLNRALGRMTGRVFVHSGATGERLLTLTGEAAGDGFGIGPADAGDVNGDGYDDLVIGSWQHGSAAISGGKVTVFSGRDGSVLDAWTGQVPGETFGFDATGMGDIDGDGKIDYLLTSAWSAIHGARSGRMFILAGE